MFREALGTAVILGTLLVLVTACASAEETPPEETPPEGWVAYHNTEHGFRLWHPADWVAQEAELPVGFSVGFSGPTAPAPPGSDPIGGGTITVVIPPPGYSLAAVVSATTRPLQAMGALQSERDIVLNG